MQRLEIEAQQHKLEDDYSTKKSEAEATENLYKIRIEKMEKDYKQAKHQVYVFVCLFVCISLSLCVCVCVCVCV